MKAIALVFALFVGFLTASTAPIGAAGGTLVVTHPAGDITLWLEYSDQKGAQQSTAPVKAAATKTALDTASLGDKVTKAVLVALDGANGSVAEKPVSLKAGATTEVSLTAASFNAVNVLKVRALTADRQPVSVGSVTLTDSKNTTLTRPVTPGRDGVVQFDRVPFGRAKVKVVFSEGVSLTQDVDVAAGSSADGLLLEMAAAAPSGSAEAKAAAGSAAANAPAEAPEDNAPTEAPANTPQTQGNPPASGTGGVGTVVGLLVLGVVGYAGYRVLHERGVTLDDTLRRLGVAPEAPVDAGGTGKPTPPPPVTVPEGHCAFCGQTKDPVTGACACSVAADPVDGTVAAAPMAQGMRLVVVAGPAAGGTFPLTESAVIGRAADNAVALPQDGTVSRKHASLTRQGESYLIRDEGSANGTFVNGMRVTERLLQPGDEIQVGGSRLRFEA